MEEILKLADCLGIYILCPLTAILVELGIRKKKGHQYNITAVASKWLSFFVIGIRALVSGCMQAFNPAFTGALLQVEMNDYIVIKELGYAAIGTGVIGVLSLKKESFRIPAAISRAIFIFCCTFNHLTRIDVVNIGEIIVIITDILLVASAVFIVITENRKLKKQTISSVTI